MNQNDNISPEEKLLRLIRQPAKKDSVSARTPARAKQTDNQHRQAKEKNSNKAPLRKKIIKEGYGMPSINFTAINRIILALIGISVSVFSYELYFNTAAIIGRSSLPVRIHLDSGTQPQGKEIKPFSYYNDGIAKRDLFKSVITRKAPQRAAPAGPAFRDLVKNLTLLGIVAGDNPQAIIEDRKLNQTYFLNEGDYIGAVAIEAIEPEKVILEYKGERLDLFI